MRFFVFIKYCAILATAILMALLLSVWLAPRQAASPAQMGPVATKRDPLRETTPYLSDHADDLVAWSSWSPEAFERARRENKPVLLSVGFEGCRWDKVMQQESFRDPEIAAFINRYFIPVKVDRDERPDIDAFYLAFVQAVTGKAGWPVLAVLTPSGYPFFGSGYLPPKDTYNTAGIRTVLGDIFRRWTSDREKIENSAKELFFVMQKPAKPSTSVRQSEYFDWTIANTALEQFDPRFGSLRKSTAQPPVSLLLFLLEYAADFPERSQARQCKDIAAFSLNRIARSALQDQLEGGFFAYASDANWQRPRFNKRLAHQAQMANAYLLAWQQTGNAYFLGVAESTLDYVLRQLSAKNGLFYSGESEFPEANITQDSYYLWTPAQVKALLGPENARIFCAHFGIEGAVMPVPLTQETTLEETAMRLGLPAEQVRDSLESSAKILLKARNHRVVLNRDEKSGIGENALMISALSRYAKLTGHPEYAERAWRAADAVKARLTDAQGKLKRLYWKDDAATTSALLDDYAFMVQALLDLREASQDPAQKESALAWAQSLQKMQDDLFWDKSEGGYFFSQTPILSGVARVKWAMDSAMPCANAVSARNLQQLACINTNPQYIQQSEQILTGVHYFRGNSPLADGTWATALRHQAALRQSGVEKSGGMGHHQ